MSKFAEYASIKTANSGSFVYTPPSQAFDATRILVKAGMGCADGPSQGVSTPVLGAVLRGLRRANPNARILIGEGGCSARSVQEMFENSGITAYMDDNMRLADLEDLQMAEYANLLPHPVKFPAMTAPVYIGDYDCCISVAAFTHLTDQNARLAVGALQNLYSVFPRAAYAGTTERLRGALYEPDVADVLNDVYFSVGYLFHGAVVDLSHVPAGKVVWGDDLLAVDESACRVANEPLPRYIGAIRQQRDALVQEDNQN